MNVELSAFDANDRNLAFPFTNSHSVCIPIPYFFAKDVTLFVPSSYFLKFDFYFE